MSKRFMPGGLSWKPDIISVRTPLCQLREEAGRVRPWHRSGGCRGVSDGTHRVGHWAPCAGRLCDHQYFRLMAFLCSTV